MNSSYLFLTIHGHGVIVEEIEKMLKENYPDWDIILSDDEFKDRR